MKPSDVVCADNLDLLRTLPDGHCDLIYVDPPFSTGSVRRTAGTNHNFEDRWSGGLRAFLPFMRPRLIEMRRVLADHGTLYVHLDWRTAAYVRAMLDELSGTACFLNEIIWHYRTGGNARRWFARKHDTILVYSRTPDGQRFNILREGIYRTDGLKRDADGRPFKSTRNGPLYFNAAGPALADVWDIPFLSTVARERCGWPTQKPLALLDRIIRASSRPGDLVADFFCGSGTTLVAAKRLGRRWLGCDEKLAAVRLARQRLAALRVDPAESPGRTAD